MRITLFVLVLLLTARNTYAAFCTGDAETLNTGALPTGYTVTLDGATDQGNGFRVTGATGSLMVENTRTDVSVTFGTMSFTTTGCQSVTLRFILPNNSYYEFVLAQPNGNFISTTSGNVRLYGMPTELDTILHQGLIIKAIQIILVRQAAVATGTDLSITMCIYNPATTLPTTIHGTTFPTTFPTTLHTDVPTTDVATTIFTAPNTAPSTPPSTIPVSDIASTPPSTGTGGSTIFTTILTTIFTPTTWPTVQSSSSLIPSPSTPLVSGTASTASVVSTGSPPPSSPDSSLSGLSGSSTLKSSEPTEFTNTSATVSTPSSFSATVFSSPSGVTTSTSSTTSSTRSTTPSTMSGAMSNTPLNTTSSSTEEPTCSNVSIAESTPNSSSPPTSTASTTKSSTKSSTNPPSTTTAKTTTTTRITTRRTLPSTTLEPQQYVLFKTSNEFIGSFMEEKWLNDKVDFSQDVKRLIKAVLESGDSNFNIPLSRIGVEDMYEGSTVFVIILKPGQDPVNDPTISEISEELCKKLNTGDPLSFFSGSDVTVLLPIDGSCIENYDIASATTSSSTKKTTTTVQTTKATEPGTGASTSDDSSLDVIIYVLVAVVTVMIIIVIIFLIYYCCCRKRERKAEHQIAPAKSEVQGHHYVRDSNTLPYTHFRRDMPERDFLRQEEYYESDEYLPPAPAPAPAPPHKGTERVPRSSQYEHDGNEYSTPPNSDRQALMKKTPPVKARIQRKRKEVDYSLPKSRDSGDGSSYTNKTYVSVEEDNLYQTVEMNTLPRSVHSEPRKKRSSRSREYNAGPEVEYSEPPKPHHYESNNNNTNDNGESSLESSGATTVYIPPEIKPLPPPKSQDLREEASVPVTGSAPPRQSAERMCVESYESDLNNTERYFPY